MIATFLIIAVSLTGSESAEPVYTLEYPGIAFGELPDVMNPPVEGTLTEESGAIASEPNSSGVEYRLHYWKEDLEPDTRKGDWLAERFRDTISPDLLPSLLISDAEWMEGSTESPYWETRSVGLVTTLNFNVINENSRIVGRGRACAVFAEGYSILFYMVTPGDGTIDIKTGFDSIISHMYLVER